MLPHSSDLTTYGKHLIWCNLQCWLSSFMCSAEKGFLSLCEMLEMRSFRTTHIVASNLTASVTRLSLSLYIHIRWGGKHSWSIQQRNDHTTIETSRRHDTWCDREFFYQIGREISNSAANFTLMWGGNAEIDDSKNQFLLRLDWNLNFNMSNF